MDYKSLLNLADRNQNEINKKLKTNKNAPPKGPDPSAVLAFKVKMQKQEEERQRKAQVDKDRLMALRSQNSKTSRRQVAMAQRTKDNNFARIKVTESDIREQETVNDKLTKQGIVDKNERMKAKMELDRKLVGLSKKDREKAIAKYEKERNAVKQVEVKKQSIADIVKQSKEQNKTPNKSPVKKARVQAPPLSYDQLLNMASANAQTKRTLEQEIHDKIRDNLPPKPASYKEKEQEYLNECTLKTKPKTRAPASCSDSPNGNSRGANPHVGSTSANITTNNNNNNPSSKSQQTTSHKSTNSSLPPFKSKQSAVGRPQTMVGNDRGRPKFDSPPNERPKFSNPPPMSRPMQARAPPHQPPRPKLPPIGATMFRQNNPAPPSPPPSVPTPVVTPSRLENKKGDALSKRPQMSSKIGRYQGIEDFEPYVPGPSGRRTSEPLDSEPHSARQSVRPPPGPMHPRGRPMAPDHYPQRQMKHLPPIGATYHRGKYDNEERYETYYDDEEEDYDEEMDDFIDDDPIEEEPEYSREIAQIFGYNKRKYANIDDDDIEEASFADCMREEKRSARLGLQEDLEDIRREEEERRAKLSRKKMR